MTTAGFVLLLVLLTIIAMVFIEFAGMPGRTARERNHSSADAINLLGWLGLFFGGIPFEDGFGFRPGKERTAEVAQPTNGDQGDFTTSEGVVGIPPN